MTKEPCQDCNKKYLCEERRIACAQFRYFVNTGHISDAIYRQPTREIYIDVFYKEPAMPPKKETA